MKNKKPVLIGLIGGSILLILYFGILTVAESFTHAIEQFTEMWYWILLLVIGFGTQLGLYSYVRAAIHAKVAGATAEVATAGGISTGSMIACCAHHATDVLPIIGLSAAAVFLTQYQLPFIILGVLSNLVGITIMLGLIQKHKLFDNKGFFKGLFRYDMKGIRNGTIFLSIVILSIAFFTAFNTQPTSLISAKVFDLPVKTNYENEVSFEIKPKDFSYDNLVTFDIRIDTHSGSLDFDMTRISILKDDKGNEYAPLNWDGSPPGGHHRSGILTFPKLRDEAKQMKLIIRDVYDIPERIFIWEMG